MNEYKRDNALRQRVLNHLWKLHAEGQTLTTAKEIAIALRRKDNSVLVALQNLRHHGFCKSKTYSQNNRVNDWGLSVRAIEMNATNFEKHLSAVDSNHWGVTIYKVQPSMILLGQVNPLGDLSEYRVKIKKSVKQQSKGRSAS